VRFVSVPPTFRQRAPLAMTALSGEEVVLPCDVTGEPIPDISWRKNHITIDLFDMNHKYLVQDTGSLIIPKVDVQDTARFLCLAENAAGVVTQEINLVVYGEKFSIRFEDEVSKVVNN
jgi:Immunoglobulin I-set domain